MTLAELKQQVEQGNDRHFFTRDTMRFFGDTMRNYGVRSAVLSTHWDNTGNIYSDITHNIDVWERYRKHPVKRGLQNSAYFDKNTFKRIVG